MVPSTVSINSAESPAVPYGFSVTDVLFKLALVFVSVKLTAPVQVTSLSDILRIVRVKEQVITQGFCAKDGLSKVAAAFTARDKSKRPAPISNGVVAEMESSFFKPFTAVEVKAVLISTGVQLGWSCFIKAAAPAT